MKIFKDLTTMSSPDYLLRDNHGKLLLKASKSECEEEMSKLTPLEYEWLLDELCTKEMNGKEFDKELDKLVERLNK